MSPLLLLLATLLSLLSAPAVNVSPIVPKGEELQHAATHRIVMENVLNSAGCSATAVGPHTLLTAGHCLVPSHSILIDANEVAITRMDFDDNDHLLLTVDETFKAYLPIVQRDLLSGEEIHYWGNPGHSRDVYRIGVFERTEKSEDGNGLNWFLAPGAPGDSGSGILDASGNIVDVLSVGNQSGEVGGFALAFTPAQLAVIR